MVQVVKNKPQWTSLVLPIASLICIAGQAAELLLLSKDGKFPALNLRLCNSYLDSPDDRDNPDPKFSRIWQEKLHH